MKKKEYPAGCDWDEEFNERGSTCPNNCSDCIFGYEKGKVEGFNQALNFVGELDEDKVRSLLYRAELEKKYAVEVAHDICVKFEQILKKEAQ